ncbi:MAG: 4Fe-4S binding protein [Desulfurivibrionaceae bacterium]|jgi:ferredoxin-type protein NapH
MKLTPIRRTVQVCLLVLLFLVPWLNQQGIAFLNGTLYSFAIGPLWITDPAIGLQTLFTTRSLDTVLLLSMLLPVVLALVCGRVFCGWLCPQNTLSELADVVAGRLKIRRALHPAPAPTLRLVMLGIILVLAAVVGLPLVSLLSAPGILSVQTARIVLEKTVGAELGLVGFIVVVEFFLVRRAWCNFLCPVGTVLGFFRVRRTMKVVFSEEETRHCTRCHACAQACQLGLDPVAGGLYPQCHNCGACIEACKIDLTRKPLFFQF